MRTGVPLGALTALLLGACGARSGLLVGGEATVDAGPDVQAAEAAACVGSSVPLVPNVPNIYFVLDTSASMSDQNKWANVRAVVANLIFSLGPDAEFGAAIFPNPAFATTNSCAPGVEVMPLRLGDSLGQTEATFLAATALSPQGGTPTSATFRALTPKLTQLHGVTFVILATDGGPNCNLDIAPCSLQQCTDYTDGRCGVDAGNCCAGRGIVGCLDEDATVASIRALSAAGVKTFVMGIPGSAPYAPVLDAMAQAGNTARTVEPLYYAVDSADTIALGASLGEIAAQTMKSCVLTLEQTPGDPTKLNVYVDGVLVPSDGVNGWKFDGQSVTLLGASCGSLQADGGIPLLRVEQGCPTVH